jgi:hypothetical protein
VKAPRRVFVALVVASGLACTTTPPNTADAGPDASSDAPPPQDGAPGDGAADAGPCVRTFDAGNVQQAKLCAGKNTSCALVLEAVDCCTTVAIGVNVAQAPALQAAWDKQTAGCACQPSQCATVRLFDENDAEAPCADPYDASCIQVLCDNPTGGACVSQAQ